MEGTHEEGIAEIWRMNFFCLGKQCGRMILWTGESPGVNPRGVNLPGTEKGLCRCDSESKCEIEAVGNKEQDHISCCPS